MRPSRVVHLASNLACALLFVGCASGGAPAPVASGPKVALDYYPIQEGNAWSYQVLDQRVGTPVLLTSRMIEVSEKGFTIDSVRQRVRYAIRGRAIFRPKSGYAILKDPLKVGAAWDIPAGGKVQVTKVGVTDTVKGGTFDNCVVIVEDIYKLQRAEWTYAADVGLIRMRIFDLREGAPKLLVSGELLSYAIGDDVILFENSTRTSAP